MRKRDKVIVMGIFEDFEPNGKFEQNAKKVKELRTRFQAILMTMKFNKFEQNEVLKVIDESYEKIRKISESLVGTNINQNPTKATDKAMKEIDKIIRELPKKIDEQMNYIIAIKKDRGEQ